MRADVRGELRCCGMPESVVDQSAVEVTRHIAAAAARAASPVAGKPSDDNVNCSEPTCREWMEWLPGTLMAVMLL